MKLIVALQYVGLAGFVIFMGIANPWLAPAALFLTLFLVALDLE